MHDQEIRALALKAAVRAAAATGEYKYVLPTQILQDAERYFLWIRDGRK